MSEPIIRRTVLYVLTTALMLGAQAKPSAARLFEQKCAVCHGNPNVARAPGVAVLKSVTAEAIYWALTTGNMSGALTAISGAVFAGGWDGVLRALDSEMGKIIWEYNTIQDYKTVNGVAAKGVRWARLAPTLADGMLFVGSGYPGVRDGTTGNVLLVFSPR